MSKIIAAANAMLANSEKISSVIAGEAITTEIFFLYNEKYRWSISHNNDEYFLYYYPGAISLKTLAKEYDWEFVDYVSYSTKEIGTKEAKDTFSELYTAVKEKLYGVEDVLDEIIDGML